MKLKRNLILLGIFAIMGAPIFHSSSTHINAYAHMSRSEANRIGHNEWVGGQIKWAKEHGYYRSHSHHSRHYHVNRAALWYQSHTYRNRVHYASSNHISSHHYQPAFIDAEDDGSIAVTNNYHSLIKGINNDGTYKVIKMIPASASFSAKYLKYISGDYNANDSDVYAILYRGHKYYYGDNLSNKGGDDPLQGYNADYSDGSISSNYKPYWSSAYLERGQHIHNNTLWDYENPKSYSETYYKYHNGHWTETADSDNVPDYIF